MFCGSTTAGIPGNGPDPAKPRTQTHAAAREMENFMRASYFRWRGAQAANSFACDLIRFSRLSPHATTESVTYFDARRFLEDKAIAPATVHNKRIDIGSGV